MRKANLSYHMYLMLVIIIGLLLVVMVMSRLTPLDSPKGRAQELAVVTAMHIDSLSASEEGMMKLETKSYKYDIEIQKWDGFWRGVGSAITSKVDRKGYYVVVTPYGNDGKKLKDTGTFIVNSYRLDKDYSSKLEDISSVCAEKKVGEPVARMVKCA